MRTLSPKFTEALAYATELHATQQRKQSGVPYIAHLLSVSALVLEHGGDETCAIAGLLHDALEDQANDGRTKSEIRERFGEAVLHIVEGCTDTEASPKPPWEARKKAYVAAVPRKDARVRLVSCADKLHNARSIVADLRLHGDALWSRFTGGKEGSLWYYRELAKAFREAGDSALVQELGRTVDEMHALAKRS